MTRKLRKIRSLPIRNYVVEGKRAVVWSGS